MPVAHQPLATVIGQLVGMAGEQDCDFGLHRLRQQRSRAVAQNLGQRVRKSSWLAELENVSVGHGVSLLRWRSGGVKHPHDTPPYPFMPSPTFAYSSSISRQYPMTSARNSSRSAGNDSSGRKSKSSLISCTAVSRRSASLHLGPLPQKPSRQIVRKLLIIVSRSSSKALLSLRCRAAVSSAASASESKSFTVLLLFASCFVIHRPLPYAALANVAKSGLKAKT